MAHLDLLVAFLNTDDDGDELASPEGLAAWGAEHGVLDHGGWVSPQDAAAVRELREALREALAGDGTARLDGCAARLAMTLLVGDGGALELAAARGGADGVQAGVLAAALAAQTDGAWPRLKLCRNAECRRAFADASRNRSRSWCDMATCGSRSKMRAYRARQHSR
jgi:predicted RNA-binding Zn ribbon-like protein